MGEARSRPQSHSAADQHAIRAEQARVDRRLRVLLRRSVLAVVVILLVGVGVVKVAERGGPSVTGSRAGLASSRVIRDVTSVSPTTLNEVGAGITETNLKRIDAPRVTTDGKPRVLYVGAEFCPFCASESWPVVVALSRFGSWSRLGATASAPDDQFPRTSAFSFHGSAYRSRYLSFKGVETSSNLVRDGEYLPLDSLSGADKEVFNRYNRAPYTSSGRGSIPFESIGGTFVSSGSSYNPTVLAGKTHQQIAGQLKDPTSAIARAVGGSANVLTAALCDLTGHKPAEVCSSSGVLAAGRQLK